jgi:hypothetical protein
VELWLRRMIMRRPGALYVSRMLSSVASRGMNQYAMWMPTG